MKTLTEQHKPKRLDEVYGQDFALIKLKDFILNYKKQKKKACIIFGPPGVGKTSSCYALAKDFNLEILELNASDYRSSEQINRIIKPAINQQSLFSKGKLIIIDEIDGILTHEDSGGVQALSSLMKTSNFPILMTANDPWNSKLSLIRKEANLIEFKNLDYVTISRALSKICSNNNVKCNQDDINKIAIKSNGDLRAAITDLQTLSEDKDFIEGKNLEIIESRYKKESVFKALRLILKTKNINEVLNAINNADIDLNEAFLWIDENLPIEYNGKDLIRAYECLSRADIFRGRISNQQYYRFLVYQNNLITAGIALAKEKSSNIFINYKRSARILKYWQAKIKYKKRKDISVKLAKLTHTSSKRIINTTLPYLKMMIKQTKNLEFGKKLSLDEDEIYYLMS